MFTAEGAGPSRPGRQQQGGKWPLMLLPPIYHPSIMHLRRSDIHVVPNCSNTGLGTLIQLHPLARLRALAGARPGRVCLHFFVFRASPTSIGSSISLRP